MNTEKQIFLYKEVYDATIVYFDGDELATNVWIKKYCHKAMNDGIIQYYEKIPTGMHWRLASEYYRAGIKYNNPVPLDVIFQLFDHFKYIIPQGRPMTGIGTDDAISISNCFVIGYPEYDSYGTIAKMDEEIIQISKRGGGTGVDLSSFRPNGAKVHNAAMTSSGPVDICAERFSHTIREVGQNGRRGALMLSMDINHPDAERFIDSKMEEGKITGANISVKVYDDWLHSAISGDTEKNRLWKKIIHNAWKSAEPGVLFWDKVINESVADCYSSFGFKTISTNPCGELPLSSKDSCRLMLFNLYSYVVKPFTTESYFDYELFKKHCHIMIKLMDNMIDLECEKIDKIIQKINNDSEPDFIKDREKKLWEDIKKTCLLGRRSGIGITAEGDMLAALGLRYGTKEATNFAINLHKIMAENVYIGSCKLVQEDGREPFGCFDYELEKNNPFLNRLADGCEDFKQLWKGGRRNIACLTIAPAGTVSLMTQTTSGIEPLFYPFSFRKRKIDKQPDVKPDFIDKTGDWFEEYYVIHEVYTHWYSVYKGISVKEAKKKLSKMKIDDLMATYKNSPYFNATANDVDWVEKVRMQGGIQEYIDHSISVTVNIPKETTEETVKMIYETAWKSGCKGCTIYREGSRDGVLTSTSAKGKAESANNNLICIDGSAAKRPKILPCKIVRFNNQGEKWVGVVGMLNDRPYEIFTGLLDRLNIPTWVEEGFIIKNKENVEVINEETYQPEMKSVSRYDLQYKDKDGFNVNVEGISRIFKQEYWNYGKMISGFLRYNMPIDYIIKVITSLNMNSDSINTWKNGVIRTLKRFIKQEENQVLNDPLLDVCPECGEKSLKKDGGCCICIKCGYSKCG